MKKFLLSFFGFFAFSVLSYVVMLFLWGNIAHNRFKPNARYSLGKNGHTYTRLKEVKKLNGIDILFLGTSHTYRGFDTRIFQENGYSSFNLGSSAQTPMQTQLLLNRYLETIKPKLVIYEVYPFAFSSDGVESSLDIIANDKKDKYVFDMVVKIDNLKTYNTFLYGSMRDFFNMDSGFSENNVHGADTYVKGGYVERDMKYFKHRTFKKTNINMESGQMDEFNKVLQSLKNHNIPYILVYAPITNPLYDSYRNKKEFNELMRNHGKYINFNEIMKMNDSLDFYDSNHLNQNGVLKFNTYLIDNYLQPELKKAP